jgi:very-short-patch-repair endonuclease
MLHFSASLAADIARHHGIVTKVDMLMNGTSLAAIRRAVTDGSLHRVHTGVYRLSTATFSFEARCVAACLADDEAVITGPAAARLWEFHHVRVPEQPIVAVSHDRSPLNRGVVVRRTNVLEPTDWVTRDDDIRVASPPRTWFDCARDLDDERFERLTEYVLDRHASVPTLWSMRSRLNSGGRPGLARVNRVLSQRAAWQKPAGSGLELRVLKSLEQRGVRGLVRQHSIRLSDGSVVHPDGALPDIKWAIEIDHVTWHGGRSDAQRDKGRDRRLRLIGWQVDRVTDQELRDDFDATIDQLVQLIGYRRRSFAA